MGNTKEWREANRDKIREYAKRYYESHRLQISEKQKKYYEKKKAECPTYFHDWYMKHHDSVRAAQKKYWEAHKDEFRVKYAHHRKAWNEAHRAYVNEHARLARHIRNSPMTSQIAQIKKDYLRELHAKGMV